MGSYKKFLFQNSTITIRVVHIVENFLSVLHPMSQFVAAITALKSESKFTKAYSDGVSKASYWEYAYEDSVNLLAKLPT
uniref:Uncharacterized protein n=1 Tax=Ditylenchus dipsaci TaxID=166011 RepID=A0A915ERZ9_9BILA